MVGSVALDTVETPTFRREKMLGGSASFFSLAASLYLPVRIVAVVGTDFLDEHRDVFANRSIDLKGLQVEPGKSFHWEGVYGADMNNRTTIKTDLNVFESFHPELPPSYRETSNVFLANIDPVLQEEVLDQLDSPSIVALDTMNYWISHRREDLLRVLRQVHLFLLNDAEARQLTGADNVMKAAEGIQMMGPSVVVIKRGEYGSLACTDRGWFSLPAFPVETVKDPTGAGDSFAGGMLGFMASRGTLDEKTVRTGMAHGTAVASFAVEHIGLEGLCGISSADVEARVRRLAEMTRFESV